MSHSRPKGQLAAAPVEGILAPSLVLRGSHRIDCFATGLPNSGNGALLPSPCTQPHRVALGLTKVPQTGVLPRPIEDAASSANHRRRSPWLFGDRFPCPPPSGLAWPANYPKRPFRTHAWAGTGRRHRMATCFSGAKQRRLLAGDQHLDSCNWLSAQ